MTITKSTKKITDSYKLFRGQLSLLRTCYSYLKLVWVYCNTRCTVLRFKGRLLLKCDGTRAETRFRLSAKRTSPSKSAGASVQSTTGSRGVRISGSNAGYTMFRGRVKGTGYPLHSPVSPSLPLPCVTVCRHVSTGLYSQQLVRVQRNSAMISQCVQKLQS
jgi:hypothetical protein